MSDDEEVLTKEEQRRRDLRQRVLNEPAFVNAKRFDNNPMTLEQRYPDGCPDHVMAAALVITVEEVQAEYQEITEKLQDLMGVEP